MIQGRTRLPPHTAPKPHTPAHARRSPSCHRPCHRTYQKTRRHDCRHRLGIEGKSQYGEYKRIKKRLVDAGEPPYFGCTAVDKIGEVF